MSLTGSTGLFISTCDGGGGGVVVIISYPFCVCFVYIYIVSTTAVTPSLWIQGTEERVCLYILFVFI